MSTRTNSQFLAASVTEFISVWAIGGDASLNLTTKGGFTTIGFNCTIGHPGAPHPLPPPPSSVPSFPAPPPRRPRHRGPSEVEKNKQRAARHQAEKANSNSESLTVTPVITAPVITAAVKPLLTTVTVAQTKSCSTAPVKSSLSSTKCDQCEFVAKSCNGLKIHTRNKHTISQIDGNNDDSEFEEIMEKDLTFICEDCDYTTGERQDLVKHAEKIHYQCAECGDNLPSRQI